MTNYLETLEQDQMAELFPHFRIGRGKEQEETTPYKLTMCIHPLASLPGSGKFFQGTDLSAAQLRETIDEALNEAGWAKGRGAAPKGPQERAAETALKRAQR